MTDPDQLRRQNASLILTLNDMDNLILALNELVEFELGSVERRLFAQLLAGTRARDAANHLGDLIAGAKT